MKRLRGLYAITPERRCKGNSLTAMIEQAIAGHARVIQYRDKGTDSERRFEEVRVLLTICRAAGIPLIINDDLELAVAAGADGVHVGRDDADPREARERLGPQAIVGVSCYDRFDAALSAQEKGADYVAFGRFFPSTTKPHAVEAKPSLLRRGRRELTIPQVAIGGITPENGRSLILAGADMLAVVDGVFGQPDIRAAALAFDQLFTKEVAPDDPVP